ncbi:4,4'-diaponeurosporenoate glycosyltransferase [Planctomycetes bacterium K23_9]|uniref:4,4'-diaponeurosporenoate glycosyltransferase n=2 Tax=Stieleria marina TaxID=1930275 RepID=A0A517NXG1_9BACT|nr:4,4'-diaponeurosporenoate glycosyltransferase [Planctomycetes bacterium K23_9]
MFVRNLPLFRIDCCDADRETTVGQTASRGSVSVLIPARDEAEGIAACIRSALNSEQVDVEVIVLDDHSSDQTAAIVQDLDAQDDRVRYVAGEELPASWNGKQFACYQLAAAASHDCIVFLDADVRLRPQALQIMIDEKQRRGVSLISQFPHQVTGTFAEQAMIPLMHFILLGYLPFARMQSSTHPAYSAGCGQCFLTTQADYQIAGTHRAIAASRHDGLKLPKIFRRANLSTDVVDGTDLADCRMYTSTSEVINGVLKNAVEGIAHPARIVPFTVLLLGSSFAPLAAAVWAIAIGNQLAIAVSLVALLVAHVPRFLAAVQFRQSWLGAATHCIAMPLFVLLQWIALANHLRGKQVAWRGR